jgi:hypothetical protein
VETPAVAVAEPAAVPEPAPAPVKPAARHSSCPACFQTLLSGYKNIVGELTPWMEEKEAGAADLDQRLSDIQKNIDAKDKAIEEAKLGADKKAAKAAVKSLSRERKAFLKEYGEVSDQKDAYYKKFSREVRKKTEGHLKLLEDSLTATLSAASE